MSEYRIQHSAASFLNSEFCILTSDVFAFMKWLGETLHTLAPGTPYGPTGNPAAPVAPARRAPSGTLHPPAPRDPPSPRPRPVRCPRGHRAPPRREAAGTTSAPAFAYVGRYARQEYAPRTPSRESHREA